MTNEFIRPTFEFSSYNNGKLYMSKELYETFCRIETLPDFDHPFNDDGSALAVIHEMAPWGVIRILSDFNVIPEEELIRDIIKGKIYVCEMFEPRKGLLLVMRNGYGWSWSFTSGTGCGYVCHQTQKLIDEWMEKVATMNFPMNIPGQMRVEFEQIEAV